MKDLDDFLKGRKPKEKSAPKKIELKFVKSVTEIEKQEEYDLGYVANYFGVTPKTIYKWLNNGIIECEYDSAKNGRRANIRFTAQQIQDRLTRRKHG